jgi:hypothetical protein
LRDVARTEVGADNYSMFGLHNQHPSTVMLLLQSPGSNALQASQGLRQVQAVANLGDAVEALCYSDEFAGFSDRGCQRLLDQNINAGLHQLLRDCQMQTRRNRNRGGHDLAMSFYQLLH